MELYTINIKKFKAIFLQMILVAIIFVGLSYFLLSNGFYFLSAFDPGRTFTLPILAALTVLAMIYGQMQKKRLLQLQEVEDFELRSAKYQRFYAFRLIWYLGSCLAMCILCLFTGRILFLYFAMFDILMILPFFPTLRLFKRELKNEEIILL